MSEPKGTDSDKSTQNSAPRYDEQGKPRKDDKGEGGRAVTLEGQDPPRTDGGGAKTGLAAVVPPQASRKAAKGGK